MYCIYKKSGEILCFTTEKVTQNILDRWYKSKHGECLAIEVDDKYGYELNENYTIVDGEIKEIKEDVYSSELIDAKRGLKRTDWKVVRHLEEKNRGSGTTLTDEEYDALTQTRNQWREFINNND